MICIATINGRSRQLIRGRDVDGEWHITTYARLLGALKVGRPLRTDEVAHHVNRDPSDDRWANVQVLTRDKHALEHPARPRACSDCGRNLTHSQRITDARGDHCWPGFGCARDEVAA